MIHIRAGFVAVMLLSVLNSRAQDINEALNLSNTSVQGTARSMGFGNALGSVGGDFSAVSVNPAGIGIYRSSEVSFTPTFNMGTSSSVYLGNTSTANTATSYMSNFSLVFTNAPKGRRYDSRKWKTVSFGIGMNRIADFNHDYTYYGTNKTSSASQAFESDNNLHPGNDTTPGTLGFIGYQAYLTNFDDTTGHFMTAVPFTQGINQMQTVSESGGINEWVISLGGNYMEKLMLGVTLGIPIVNYNRQVAYSETYTGPSSANPFDFNSFNYSSNLNITGGGANLKLGAIYKITDRLRIGAAFHSPTFYSLNDNLSQRIDYNSQGQSGSFSSQDILPVNTFNYQFITPWKTVLSATWILKTHSRTLGFISADYEYENFSTMHYNYPSGTDYSSGMSFQQEQSVLNDTISIRYHAVSNLRVGAEIMLTRYFMVRGGLGYYGNPYSSSQNMNGQRVDLSCGLGFHFRHFFTDLGIVHSIYKYYEQPYSIDFAGVYSGPAVAIPTSATTYNINKVAFTIGFKF